MQVLLIIQILLVIGLVAVILVQKTSSDGFTGASSPGAFLTGRGQANLFTHITSILATLFIINSLVLAYIASHTERNTNILEKLNIETTETKSDEVPATPADTMKEIQDKIGKIAGDVSNKANEMAEDTKEVATDIKERASDKAEEISDNIKEAATDVKEKIKEIKTPEAKNPEIKKGDGSSDSVPLSK